MRLSGDGGLGMKRFSITQYEEDRIANLARGAPPGWGVEIRPDGAISLCPPPHNSIHALPVAEPVQQSVYFVACGEFVKIGMSEKPLARFRKMRTDNPFVLTLLHTMIGGFALERSLHLRFAEYRHQYEWFRHEGALKVWIEEQIKK